MIPWTTNTAAALSCEKSKTLGSISRFVGHHRRNHGFPKQCYSQSYTCIYFITKTEKYLDQRQFVSLPWSVKGGDQIGSKLQNKKCSKAPNMLSMVHYLSVGLLYRIRYRCPNSSCTNWALCRLAIKAYTEKHQ